MANGSGVKIGIGGDASPLVGALGQAEQIIQQFAEQARGSLQRFAQGVGDAFDWDAQVAKGGHILAAVVKDLNLLIKGMAGQVTVAAKNLLDFADQISRVTEFSNEAAVAVEKVFLAMGTLDETGIKRATVAAADMAAEIGMAFQDAADLIASAMKNPIGSLDALRAAGVAFTNDEIKLLKAMTETNDVAGMQAMVLGKVEEAMNQAANKGPLTMAKAMASLKNAWDDFMQLMRGDGSIWNAFAPIVQKAADIIRSVFVPALRVTLDTLMSFKQVIKEFFLEAITAAMAGAIVAFTAAQVVVLNWKDSMHVAFLSVELAAVKAFSVIQYWLANVIPQYLKWMADNWKTIFQNIGETTTSIVGTLVDNVESAITAMMSKVKAVMLREAKYIYLGIADLASKIPFFGDSLKGVKEDIANSIDPNAKGQDFKPKGFNLPGGKPLDALPKTDLMPKQTDAEKEILFQLKDTIQAMGFDFDKFLEQNKEIAAKLLKGGEDAQKLAAQKAIDDARGGGGGKGKGKGAAGEMRGGIEGLVAFNERLTVATLKPEDPAAKAIKEAEKKRAADALAAKQAADAAAKIRQQMLEQLKKANEAKPLAEMPR